ncbi:MAG TPA: acyltransferase, partial [Chloroflexota bacterium]|nr:acyltransferase [Chloroflexota bacterium]
RPLRPARSWLAAGNPSGYRVRRSGPAQSRLAGRGRQRRGSDRGAPGLAGRLGGVPFAPFDKWDTPSWSVSAEMFFYWLFPAFAYGALRHVRTRRAGLVLVAGLYLAGALLLVGLASLNPIFLAASRFLPLTRLWEFLIGAGLGYLRLRHGPSNRRRDGVLALLLVGLIVVAYLPRPGRVDEVAWYFGTAPLNAALIALLGNASGIWERLLAHRWLQELGDASYALYLLQQPAIYATFYLVGASSWHGWLAIPLTIALLAGSVAVHRGIEAPARRWLLATRPEERVAVRDPVHTPTAS